MSPLAPAATSPLPPWHPEQAEAPAEVEPGSAVQWELGPLTLRARRGLSDWQFAAAWVPDHLHPASSQWGPAPEECAPTLVPGAKRARIAFEASPSAIRLRPATGDRPFLITADPPLLLLAGEKVRILSSTPLWVQAWLGTPATLALEWPTYRPSDAWLGPLTREGELCYASKTRGRLPGDTALPHPMRVQTAAILENRANSPLVVEKFRLPLPQLSVFTCTNGLLWTQTVRLTRLHEGDLAALELDPTFPPEAQGVQLLRGPRQDPPNNALERAFHWLRSGGLGAQ